MKTRMFYVVMALVLTVALAVPMLSATPVLAATPTVASVTATAFGSDTTAHDVDMPATVDAGDLLIVLFTNDDDDTVTEPSGWNELASDQRGGDVRLSVYYKIAAGTEDGTTVDFVTSDDENAAAQVYRITGWHGTTPPEISTATTGDSTSANPGSLDPTGWGTEDTLWIAVAGTNSYFSTTGYPTNYTNGVFTQSKSSGSGGCGTSSARRALNAASEDPGSFTNANFEWVAFTVAVRPAPECTTYYKDHDVDTYGNSSDSQCLDAPTGEYTVTVAGDCDDDDATINPGATEICDDGKDNDCDGDIDCDDSDCLVDADIDGYNAEPCGTDCDDGDADINPGVTEDCDDMIDNDCDGVVDCDLTTQLAIILDGSGSINQANPNNWNTIINGLADAVGNVSCVPQDGSVELTVVQFSDDAALEVGPVVLTAANAAVVNADILAIKGRYMDGWTCIACGICLAADTLAGSPNFNTTLKQALNLVTDGEPNRCIDCVDCTGECQNTGCSGTTAKASAEDAREYAINTTLLMTPEQDEFDAEFIGTKGTASDWLKDEIVWPEQLVDGNGYYAPPFDKGGGWVRVVEDADEFAATICEKLKMIVEELDFGDAPEGGVAYPSSGVMGQFPTCMTVGIPLNWIQHGLGLAHFAYLAGPQPPWDAEPDGNAGLCPGCFPTYDDDECYLDGDAGLMFPEPYTINATGALVTCPNSTTGTPLGLTCQQAVWGTDVDIWVVNNMPNDAVGYVNVLMDWNQDGQWAFNISTTCPAANPTPVVPEHVLVNFPIPNPYAGPLSLVPGGPPLLPFQIGPNPGYVWTRFTISERPVGIVAAITVSANNLGNNLNHDWNGEGIFEDGETEDYLLRVDETPTGACCNPATGTCEDELTAAECQYEWTEGGSCAQVTCVPKMTIDKDVVGVAPVGVAPGGTVKYTIDVTNTDTATAINVSIWDTLGPWFTYASTDPISYTGGAARSSSEDDFSNSSQPTWKKFIIPSGGSVTITFTANVDPNIPVGTYQNTAYADGDNFTQIDDIGNQGYDADTPPLADPEVDENVFVAEEPPPQVTGVPTLSQWGMIGMGILFAAFLIWTVRRRWVVSADGRQE